MKIILLHDKDVMQDNIKVSKKRGEAVIFFDGLAKQLIKDGLACLPEDFLKAQKPPEKKGKGDVAETKPAYYPVYYGGGRFKIMFGNPAKHTGEEYQENGEAVTVKGSEDAQEYADRLNKESL